MAQQIHPSAFRLGLIKHWLSFSHLPHGSHSYFVYHDSFLRSFFHGFCLSFGWFSSELSISHRHHNHVLIQFLVFPNRTVLSQHSKFSAPVSSLPYLLKLAKDFLHFWNPHLSYTIQIRETKSFCHNAKILADWIDLRISQDPRLFRRVLFLVLREFRRLHESH